MRAVSGKWRRLHWRATPCTTPGMTIIEITVILAILLILGGALAPVLSDSISTARVVRAKNDVMQIATGLVGFSRDVGSLLPARERPLVQDADSPAAVVEVLATGGAMPLVGAADPVGPSLLARSPAIALGETLMRDWIDLPSESIDDHLRRNARGYPDGSDGVHAGWNGPYLSRPIDSDPWGHAYLVNACRLKFTPPHGHVRNRAVFVLSAGPDGIIQTPFDQPIENASVFGDDIVVRIQ